MLLFDAVGLIRPSGVQPQQLGKVSKFSWLLPNVGPVYPTFSAFAETFSPNRLAVWNIVRIFDPSNQKIVSLLE